MPLIEYNEQKPRISANAFVSPNATLIGDVQVLDNAVIWPGAVLRAENAPITIGEYSTVFDGVMIFTRSNKSPVNVGNYCILESGATLFGCFMEDYILVSKNCCVYEGCSIGEGVILLNDSVVPSGMVIPARAILKGNPVMTIREQSRNDVWKMKDRAEHFSELFVKIREQLPQAQPYLITLPDFVKMLLSKENFPVEEEVGSPEASNEDPESSESEQQSEDQDPEEKNDG